MFNPFGYWFQTAEYVLFALEILILQVWLIVHMVRALFFPCLDSRPGLNLAPNVCNARQKGTYACHVQPYDMITQIVLDSNVQACDMLLHS
jgi:hypothetical protein